MAFLSNNSISFSISSISGESGLGSFDVCTLSGVDGPTMNGFLLDYLMGYDNKCYDPNWRPPLPSGRIEYFPLGLYLLGPNKVGAGFLTRSGGTFYRAMSHAEFEALKAGNGLTYKAGTELFVSSSASYSRAYLQKTGYDVLVKFNLKRGAMNYFNQVGVMHRTAAGSSGWAARGNLLWKFEKGTINLGIHSNTHMFNPWIKNFKVIR